MRKKLLAFIFLLVAIMIPLSACSNKRNGKDEHLSYFETERFTAESFKEAVKQYGSLNTISYTDGTTETHYLLTENQAAAGYKNDTIKQLLTSEYYDNCSNENIQIGKLWKYLGNDLFAEDITFTIDSLVSTIKQYCVWSSGSTHYIISDCDYNISNNSSVKEICKNSGVELFNKLYTEDYGFYVKDIVELFERTETWNINCSIAYKSEYLSYSYPLAFEKSDWSKGLSSEIESCIKSRLRDPDSYQSDGTIGFYLKEEPNISNGIYYSSIYVRVPIRAKNGFGGYGNAIYWLNYNWRNNTVSWYGETIPNGIKFSPFKTL